jgi:hypothetical protein
VDTPAPQAPQPPIGILASLAAGFDRIAARPALILPPLILDLFLWLGPHIRAQALIGDLARSLQPPAGIDPALTEQVVAMQQGFVELALRFNVLSALSALPAGVPSLMASRMPAANPLGTALAAEGGGPAPIAGLWVLFTVLGLGLGAVFQVLIARQVSPPAELAPMPQAWGRLLLLSAAMYSGLFVAVSGTAVAVSLASLVLPLLGAGVMFLAFSLVFWLAIYLAFTPHGIIRYRLGVWQAMRTSMQLVRWNMPTSVAFLGLVLLVTYAAGWVWAMPAEDSWFAVLAIVGHALISSMLLAGSYAFFQGRHEWMLHLRRAYLARVAAMTAHPTPRREE